MTAALQAVTAEDVTLHEPTLGELILTEFDGGTSSARIRIDQADPVIIISDHLVGVWRDGDLPRHLSLTEDVAWVRAVNGDVHYRIGSRAPEWFGYEAHRIGSRINWWPHPRLVTS